MVEFSLGPCKVRLHFLFLAAMGIVLFTDVRGTALLGIGAVVIHESGHLLLMLLFGIPPKLVEIHPFGVILKEPADCQTTMVQEGWISLGGPLANGLAAMVLLLLRPWLPAWGEEFLLYHLALGIFNLLPVESLDGGRALTLFLLPVLGRCRTGILVTILSLFCLIPLGTVGFLLLLQSPWNFSLLLVSVYLMLCLVLKNQGLFSREP